METNIKDKCNDCEELRLVINVATQKCTTYCPKCKEAKELILKEYLDDEEEARELPEYEDDFHSSVMCHEWQIGGKL
jgi:hypothetical protein